MSVVTKLKQHVLNSKHFNSFVSFLFNLPNIHRIRVPRDNLIIYNCAFLKKVKIRIIGKNNVVNIGRSSYLKRSSVLILGNNNTINIGEKCGFLNTEFHIEDDNNSIIIGNETTLNGIAHLACIESCKIQIGNDCMFSKDIVVRTGDSHSILDETGKRFNYSKDIIIGNHVWVGNRTIITKGVIIGDNSVVGTGSIVTKVFSKSNLVIAGSPAILVKENINWLRKRI